MAIANIIMQQELEQRDEDERLLPFTLSTPIFVSSVTSHESNFSTSADVASSQQISTNQSLERENDKIAFYHFVNLQSVKFSFNFAIHINLIHLFSFFSSAIQ